MKYSDPEAIVENEENTAEETPEITAEEAAVEKLEEKVEEAVEKIGDFDDVQEMDTSVTENYDANSIQVLEGLRRYANARACISVRPVPMVSTISSMKL